MKVFEDRGVVGAGKNETRTGSVTLVHTGTHRYLCLSANAGDSGSTTGRILFSGIPNGASNIFLFNGRGWKVST